MTQRNVLLTGASGFIGARVAERLHNQGHRLALLLRKPKPNDRASALYDKVTLIVGDLENPASYENAVRDFAGHACARRFDRGYRAPIAMSPAKLPISVPRLSSWKSRSPLGSEHLWLGISS